MSSMSPTPDVVTVVLDVCKQSNNMFQLITQTKHGTRMQYPLSFPALEIWPYIETAYRQWPGWGANFAVAECSLWRWRQVETQPGRTRGDRKRSNFLVLDDRGIQMSAAGPFWLRRIKWPTRRERCASCGGWTIAVTEEGDEVEPRLCSSAGEDALIAAVELSVLLHDRIGFQRPMSSRFQ